MKKISTIITILFIILIYIPKIYSGEIDISAKSVDLSYKNSSNYEHSNSKKSITSLSYGLNISLNYTDSNIIFNNPVQFSKEFNEEFDDYKIINISPKIKYISNQINIFAGGIFNKNYEDFEVGISNMKTDYYMRGFHTGFSKNIFNNSEIEMNFNYKDLDYKKIMYSDRKEKSVSIIFSNNFYGKTSLIFKTIYTDIVYDFEDLQDNKEYSLSAGFKGNLSDKVEGTSEFIVQRKNYVSAEDVTKTLFNFSINTSLTKKLYLFMNYNFDICENYILEYDTSATLSYDNRYYELSEFKIKLTYKFNEYQNINFTSKFSRKNYSDLTDIYPVDKLLDYNAEHNYLFSYKKIKFNLSTGIRYFTKKVSPEIVSSYDGYDIYTKLSASF
ncbi:hypothetical protein KA977_07920 [Candidatus Dependentiae bacterium]|nr:hypothetical protein [Candidatus Dependentiae bacterium]